MADGRGADLDLRAASRALSDTMVQSTSEEQPQRAPWGKQPEQDSLDGSSTLRRRRKRRTKVKPAFGLEGMRLWVNVFVV